MKFCCVAKEGAKIPIGKAINYCIKKRKCKNWRIK